MKYIDDQESRGIAGKVKKWARNQGKTTGLYMQTGGKKSCIGLVQRVKFHIADKLIFTKLRSKLGLQKVSK